MSQREKILAALVVVALLGVVGFIAAGRVQGAFASRQSQIDALEQQIHQKQLTELAGQEASDKLARYRERSLPGTLEEARSQYQEWLLATTEEFFGENDVLVTAAGSGTNQLLGSQTAVYDRLDFDIRATGNLEQVTRFLYRFYDLNYLHRVQSLQLSPIKDSKNLNIGCRIEALMVHGNSRQSLDEKRGDRLALESVDEYLEHILGRNVFGQPNNSPEFERMRSQTVDRGSSYRQTISVRDVDPLDSVTIQLDKGPPGMRLDGNSLSWLPRETGTFDVSISATDDGLPNKTARLDFTIEVREPRPRAEAPPPTGPPPFDKAKYTYLGSVQSVAGEPVVWFYDRTTPDSEERAGLPLRFVCREGDEVQVGEFRALVRRIEFDPPQVELEVEDEILVVDLGKSLREGVVKSVPQVGQTSPTSGSVDPID